jgi:hypothetical protein
MTQIALAYVATVLLAGGQGKQEGAAEPPLIRAVDAFVTAASQEDEKQLPGLFGKVFAEFTQADGTARSAAIRKLVAAYVRADELRERLLPYTMLHRLPIPKDELALAVADHLFHENAETARKWARVLNDKLGLESQSGYVDLRDFEARIGTFPKNAETQSVLRYLFQKSPSSALLLLARHHVRGKEEFDLTVKDRIVTTYLLRRKHDPTIDRAAVATVTELFKGLADSRHAWVRLYVVEMMIQNPVLRDDALVEKLTSDKDELLSLAVLDLKKPKERIRHRPVRTPWTDLD